MISNKSRRRRFATTGAVALAAATVFASPAASAEKQPGRAVTRWVERALDAVRAQNVATPNGGRQYALVSAAMYDAVNGIDRAQQRGRTHAIVAPDGAPPSASREIAAAAAAHAVLTGTLRRDQPPVSDGALDRALDSDIAAAGGTGQDPVASGLDWGRRVGSSVVSARAQDGTEAAQTIGACSRFADPFDCEPGEFHASFDARWRNMQPFGIASGEAFASGSPPALDSAEYAQAFEDVRTCGSNSSALDAACSDPATPAERSEISHFWLAEARTVRETGTWMQASLALAEQQRTVRSISDTSRLFALVAMAIADAVKVSWEAKATYFTWRPTHAIRRAEEDGNPATDASDWTARLSTIGGSPEYNSGTSAFAGAASSAIEAFYCRTDLPFSFQTDGASAGARSYSSPLEAAREAGRSRIFQGIHFQFSNEDGRRAGRAIGSEIARTRLRPVGAAAQAVNCS